MIIDKKIKLRLFPPDGNRDIWNKLQIDVESISYISVPQDANIITNIILQHCNELNIDPSENIITDATAGAGGNVFSFSKYFKKVNAIEINISRYKFLVNNLNVYKITNVIPYHDDSLNLILDIYQDIIFFDPPWGGKDYKKNDNLRLNLGKFSIEYICLQLLNCKYSPKIIALKLPKNYDLKYLHKIINIKNIKKFVHHLKKMYLIVICNYNNCNNCSNIKLLKN